MINHSGKIDDSLKKLLSLLKVEGVCSQTEFYLRQAIELDMDIILVLNKIDRLVIELKLSTADAYAHLRRLLEQVNSALS